MYRAVFLCAVPKSKSTSQRVLNKAAFEGMTGVESRSALIRKTSNNNTHHNTTRSNTKQTNKQTKVIVFNYELYICLGDRAVVLLWIQPYTTQNSSAAGLQATAYTGPFLSEGRGGVGRGGVGHKREKGEG